MQPPAIAEAVTECRCEPRSNMFIAAVLKGAGFSAPVRIRNMSSSGALAEGAAVPQPGSAVRLVRGALVVPAEVVWSSDGRCGLRFVSLVAVREWLAPPSNRQQQRIDEAVRVVKAGAIPLPLGSEAHDAASAVELAADLKTACVLLEHHCDDLLADPQAAARYGERLQNLDIILKMIAAVAGMLSGAADESATTTRLQNLRISAGEALKRAS